MPRLNKSLPFLLSPSPLSDGQQLVGSERHGPPLPLTRNLDETDLRTCRYGAGEGYAVTHGLIKSLIARALNASMSSSGSSMKSRVSVQ
jgi:hypothetical protein